MNTGSVGVWTQSNDLQLYSGVRNEEGRKYFTKSPLHTEMRWTSKSMKTSASCAHEVPLHPAELGLAQCLCLYHNLRLARLQSVNVSQRAKKAVRGAQCHHTAHVIFLLSLLHHSKLMNRSSMVRETPASQAWWWSQVSVLQFWCWKMSGL